MTTVEPVDIFDHEVTDPDRDILVWPIELANGITGGCVACGVGCATWWTRWGRGREVCVHALRMCRTQASVMLTAALSGQAERAQVSSRRRGRGVYARGEQVEEARRETASVLGPGPDLAGTASRFYVPGRCPTPWYVVGPAGVCPRSDEAGARALARHLIAGDVEAVTIVSPDDDEITITG